MVEEPSAYGDEPLPPFDWTTVEEAIRDVECLGAALTALGTAEDPVEQRVVFWLGAQLAEAGERLRGQLRARPRARG